MRIFAGSLLLTSPLVALALFSSACGSDGGASEATLTKMSFRGEIQDFGTDLPKATGSTQMCVRDYDVLECGEDDGTGFNMEIPAARDIVVELENGSYPPHLLHVLGRAASFYEFPMMSQAALDELADVAGASNDGGKGVVLIRATDGDFGLSGVTFSLVGSGVAPTYYSSLYTPDELLSNTSGSGFVAFAGVDPGTYTINLSYPNDLCGSFWRGSDGDGVFTATVEAGTVTYAGLFECSAAIAPSGGDETGA